MKRHWFTLAAILLGGTQAATQALAQDFPKKQPLRIIAAVNAGGATDNIARTTAEFLSQRLGQTVIVENKPGASGTIGADMVAKSPADGYTILITGSEFPAVPTTRKTPYKYDEMTYLVRGFLVSPLLYGSPHFQVNNAPELVAYMKANPGKVRYGSTGIGAIVHMGVAMLEGAAGVKGLHVPYAGIAPVYNDLLAGHIDISEGAPPFPQGIKVLAAVGSKRNAAFPNVPTLGESGLKAATWDQWFGFLAPPNLPKPIADRLVTELSAVLKDPQAIAKFKSTVTYEPDPAPLIGEAFRKQVIEENKAWKAVVEREKIVIE
jgi:tripartite-type tricarboxylate transporter receptor subunit TctC